MAATQRSTKRDARDAEARTGTHYTSAAWGRQLAQRYLAGLRRDPESVELEGYIDDVSPSSKFDDLDHHEARIAFCDVIQAELKKLIAKDALGSNQNVNVEEIDRGCFLTVGELVNCEIATAMALVGVIEERIPEDDMAMTQHALLSLLNERLAKIDAIMDSVEDTPGQRKEARHG